MIYRILVNPGTPQAWEIVLRPGVNRIGSSPENDFTIDHPSISPNHCEVLVSDAGAQLKDLGSKSGTFVNGAPIEETWLQSGQPLQLGAINTIFAANESAPTVLPVSQPAPGATVIVAAIGSPSNTERLAATPAHVAPTATDQESLRESAAEASSRTTTGSKKFPVHLAAEREAVKRKRFILGAMGAATGSFLGVLLWFLMIKSTEAPLLVMAWGVGAATGFGAVFLTKHGGAALGVAAATCALVAILFGESLAVKAIVQQEAMKRSVAAYRVQLEFAKEAVRAETPEDFRKLMAQVSEKSPDEFTEEQIKKFQDEEMPALRNFARGKPSRTEFAAGLHGKLVEEFDHRKYFFKEDIKSGFFLVLFATLGIATAYKVGSGKKGEG